jgi:NADH-quinone oxidoreductase subunit L
MLNLLWLVPTFPLAGFLAWAATGGSLPNRWAPWLGAGTVGLAAVLTAGIGAEFLTQPPPGNHFRQILFDWIGVADFRAEGALYLDALSLQMLFVVTGVGFLIHVYSAGYMADDLGQARFFAYMNLFVAAMLILVLADNLILLYLGWEGVGLCSYLLIGFWYDQPENGYAARKAFVVTRVGDTAMALGLFLLFDRLGTLDIQAGMARAVDLWPSGSPLPTAAALLLLGGAVGKSAQLPLQVWLPDAMAGPTPISALIHAATMVTAGVYLIARTQVLFHLAPEVQGLVGIVGAATLLLASCSALVQTDIKRVLAYSTVSQIGYMFLALGAGAWSAAIFHLMTHAFFKALLFLAAGAVILALHHEQNIFRMGGLRQRLPLVFWTFVAGAAALVALPLTSGYSSKHEILLAAYQASPWLWAAGALGALLTALYTSRLVLVAFFGPQHAEVHPALPVTVTLPLVVLAVLSIAGGWLRMPLAPALPEPEIHSGGFALNLVTAAIPMVGVVLALGLFRQRAEAAAAGPSPFVADVSRLWFSGWGFDWIYQQLLVRPFLGLAAVNRADVVDAAYRGIARLARLGHRALSASQTGRLRWYAAAMLLGTVLVLAAGVVS